MTCDCSAENPHEWPYKLEDGTTHWVRATRIHLPPTKDVKPHPADLDVSVHVTPDEWTTLPGASRNYAAEPVPQITLIPVTDQEPHK
mgnify:CR=1 FL=1